MELTGLCGQWGWWTASVSPRPAPPHPVSTQHRARGFAVCQEGQRHHNQSNRHGGTGVARAQGNTAGPEIMEDSSGQAAHARGLHRMAQQRMRPTPCGQPSWPSGLGGCSLVARRSQWHFPEQEEGGAHVPSEQKDMALHKAEHTRTSTYKDKAGKAPAVQLE